MSERSIAAPDPGGRVARAGAAIVAVLRGLVEAVRYFLRRPVRGLSPRLGFMGMSEAIALFALVAGLVAALMTLVDPLVLGIRFRLPFWVVQLFERVTDLGQSGVVLWPLGLAILYVIAVTPALDPMGRKVAASVLARLGFLFVSIGAVGLIATILKRILGRARPHAASVLAPDGATIFQVMAWKSSFASFPSGHATTVFATAVAFAALYPKARKALLALAVIVALSRIAIGSHFPSDVVAGAALGTLFVLAMVKVFAARRLVFAVGADGAVHPKAGPAARHLGHLFPRWTPAPAAAPSDTPASLEEARP